MRIKIHVGEVGELVGGRTSALLVLVATVPHLMLLTLFGLGEVDCVQFLSSLSSELKLSLLSLGQLLLASLGHGLRLVRSLLDTCGARIFSHLHLIEELSFEILLCLSLELLWNNDHSILDLVLFDHSVFVIGLLNMSMLLFVIIRSNGIVKQLP